MNTNLCDSKTFDRDRVSRGKGATAVVQRLADTVLGVLLLVATLPLLALVSLLIKWESPGPVLYRVPRTGRDGRRFELLHFRTCPHDSDPRRYRTRTSVGEFLYATRLDCLPEVFNLMRGDLSIFGPGPSAWSLF